MFTKKMDLDNLEFKVFFLTRRIMETEYEIWGNTDNVWSGMFNALMLGVNKKKMMQKTIGWWKVRKNSRK